MCDIGPFRNWLFAILAAILAAVGFIVAAAVANGSIFAAAGSPVLMGIAAALSALAALFCGFALNELNTLCACLGVRCSGPCDNLRNTLNAIRVVLGIQATAAAGVALIAWIPVAPQPLMWIIIGALVIQAALVISLLAFLNSLERCARPAPPTGPPGPPRDPV